MRNSYLGSAALGSFFLRFASALPFVRCSLEAFISFGTVVRSCLICVGTNKVPGAPGLELDVCAGCDSHEARRTGTDSNKDKKDSKSGVAFFRFQVKVSTIIRSQHNEREQLHLMQARLHAAGRSRLLVMIQNPLERVRV